MAGESVAARRAKLQQAQTLLNQLVQINEAAARIESTLEGMDPALSEAEVENTMNGILDGAGPPVKAGPAALDECTGDTISDRLVNLLNDIDVADGIDWTAEAA